jgi:hypothetical protein
MRGTATSFSFARRLNIEFVEDGEYPLPRDSTWEVNANPTNEYIKSKTDIEARLLLTNENSINKDCQSIGLASRPGQLLEDLYKNQYPIVHEFGHTIGILHPGTGKPGRLPSSTIGKNDVDSYTEDWEALMGGGSEMRGEYFSGWQKNLEATHSDQGPFVIIPPKPAPKPDTTKTISPGYPG